MNDSESFLLFQRKRRSVITLNVTALIDVCSLIIIFLILGTAFGASSLDIPKDVLIPKSISKENLDLAISVQIENQVVRFGADSFALASFVETAPNRPAIIEKIKGELARLPNLTKQSGILMNFIADYRVPYQDIYNVVATLRASGVDSVLFIAVGTK